MIKSFKGNSLTELDKEVNAYLNKNPLARVINFSASNSGGSVSKMVYIYIVEFHDLIISDELKTNEEEPYFVSGI